jgi:signal transduction histidine kinase
MTLLAANGARGLTLRRRVTAAFVGLAILFGVLTAVIIGSLVQFAHAGNDVIYRWQPAVTRSQDLLADLVNQETGVRGYALSGASASLEPYTQYLAKQRTDTVAMRTYIGNHPAVQRELDDFTAAATAWQTSVAQPLIAAVRAHQPGAAALVDTTAAKHTFDLIRARAATLNTDTADRSRRARAQRHEAQRVLDIALAVAGALILIAGVLLLRGLRRWVLRPVQRLAEQTRLVAEGDIHRPIRAGGPPELYELGRDVETMRDRITDELAKIEAAQQEVVRRSEELARSNSDLEQFAYVASHDLSEPLRKVANFCQLLELQYGDQLDDKAKQYIDFAVDGARRMQKLITDLLAFSRVGRTTDAFVDVPLANAFSGAVDDLESAIIAAGALVEHGELPTVPGDQALLTLLLQNLIGNAIKYRGPDAPKVRLDAEPLSGGGWQLSVSDNGIGIDPQYAERIFAIFQRLHLRDEYDGTGIGLAVARKIVEFHGGRIWLDPEATSSGATFRFTLAEGSPSVR